MGTSATTIIEANRPWWRIDWRELWEYRDLLSLLVKRDLTSVYKQTVLGPLWIVIRPLLTTIVFTIIFGSVARIPTDGVPHFIFYMSGTILWNYFQGVLNQGAGALVANSHLLAKVYFPRLTIPLGGVFTNLVHLGLAFATFLGFYAWFIACGSDLTPNLWLLLLPVLILQCGLLGLGFGLWVSSLTIRYRDLQFALPFLVQLWMYGTPIIFPASMVVKPSLKLLLWLNPMTAIIEFGRHGFTGTGTVHVPGLLLSWGVTLLVLLSGLFLFNKVQRTFVDTI